MQIAHISYRETNRFSSLILDYIEEKEALRSFYTKFPSEENLLELAGKRRFSTVQRETISKVLLEQNVNPTEKQAINLELINEDNTFTVTTGHQLCLFGGPLYFFLKIISCINLTKKLNALKTSSNFIPVFWMASEDHDFEEINHIHLFGKKVEWKRDFGEHVGEMKLASIEVFKNELFEILGDSAQGKELKELFEACYSSTKTLSEATRLFVHRLFAEEGLLILDANNSSLKRAFKPFMQQEIESALTFKSVRTSIDSFPKEYKIQANPSECNLFYLDNSKRKKIKRQSNEYFLQDTTISQQELLNLLEDSPEKFSPNVLFRPLYQEFVLPNIAYVGGGGELAYWLELKKSFESFDVDFPALVLRNSVLILDQGAVKKIEKFSFSEIDLFKTSDELIKKHTLKAVEEDLFIEEKKQVKVIFNEIKEKLIEVDKSLGQAAGSEEQKLLNGLDKLNAKRLKAIKNKSAVEVQQIQNVLEKLFPNHGLQERKENFASFYMKYGQSFLSDLLEKLDPLNTSFSVLKP
ncbi:MAG: bacillithiol biosynthesis cysteine-adding enzyme BshC [Bacteroidota bacterium]